MIALLSLPCDHSLSDQHAPEIRSSASVCARRSIASSYKRAIDRMPLAVVATAVSTSWSSATNVVEAAPMSDEEDAEVSDGAGGGDSPWFSECAAFGDAM